MSVRGRGKNGHKLSMSVPPPQELQAKSLDHDRTANGLAHNTKDSSNEDHQYGQPTVSTGGELNTNLLQMLVDKLDSNSWLTMLDNQTEADPSDSVETQGARGGHEVPVCPPPVNAPPPPVVNPKKMMSKQDESVTD